MQWGFKEREIEREVAKRLMRERKPFPTSFSFAPDKHKCKFEEPNLDLDTVRTTGAGFRTRSGDVETFT